jgi:predicted DNA-binding ribbon-helix-helix protein
VSTPRRSSCIALYLSARRPASVIRSFATSNVRAPAITRSAVVVASPARRVCGYGTRYEILASAPPTGDAWEAERQPARPIPVTAMKSQIVKRSIVIAGRKTSISLEDAFWNGLKEIAASRDVPLPYLVEQIDRAREHDNLSSAIRLFVLRYYRDQLYARPTSRGSRS